MRPIYLKSSDSRMAGAERDIRFLKRREQIPNGHEFGSGIQFDVYPQEGGTLDTETSGTTSLTVDGGGEFLITTNNPTSGGTILLHAQQKGDIHLNTEDGVIHLDGEGADGILLDATVIRIVGLPTTNPGVTGQLWNNGGVLSVS